MNPPPQNNQQIRGPPQVIDIVKNQEDQKVNGKSKELNKNLHSIAKEKETFRTIDLESLTLNTNKNTIFQVGVVNRDSDISYGHNTHEVEL